MNEAKELNIFYVFQDKTPTIYAHIYEAIENQQTTILTYWPVVDRLNDPKNMQHLPNPNRSHALWHNIGGFFNSYLNDYQLNSAGPDQSWDEYPFACTLDGGTDSSVMRVPAKENSIQGGQLSTFLQINDIKRGDKFRIELVASDNTNPFSGCIFDENGILTE